jgi:GT2 family glycosyltransferase
VDVSIVILNYNTFEMTCRCLSSLPQALKGISYEVILVDNASTDVPPDTFRELFPNITLIANRSNAGFSRGNNLGIRHARGEYILLLNSDAYFTDASVKHLLAHLSTNNHVGVVSPRLLFPDGRVQSCAQRFPSVRYSLFELLRIQKLLPRGLGGRLLLGSFLEHDRALRVDWVWGTCMMIRHAAIRQLPERKLDESFFMYGEDIQWCLDFARLGFETHYLPEAKVTHEMGGSGADRTAMMERHRQLFMERNYSAWHRLVIGALERLLKWTN